MDLNDDGNGGGEHGTADDLITGGGAGGEGVGDQGDGSEGAGGDSGAGGEAGTGDGGGAGGGSDPDWYDQVSAETGEGESASTRDWLKSSGVKDINGLAKLARDNQRALRESGRVKVPGEGASETEIAEYRKAIGVPDDAKGYAVPEIKDAAGNPIPLNTEMTDRITAAAHKIGVPKAALDALLEGEIRAQLEEHDAQVAELTKQANDHVKSWGADREGRLASVNAAAKAFGLTKPDLAALRAALGPAKALDMLAKAGESYNEDTLIQGDRKTFGKSAEEAQKELDEMKADASIKDKITVPGTPEYVRYNRLLDIVAAAADKAPAA